jgi:hypothetical protein
MRVAQSHRFEVEVSKRARDSQLPLQPVDPVAVSGDNTAIQRFHPRTLLLRRRLMCTRCRVRFEWTRAKQGMVRTELTRPVHGTTLRCNLACPVDYVRLGGNERRTAASGLCSTVKHCAEPSMRLNTAFESPTLATYLLHRIGTPENVSGSETGSQSIQRSTTTGIMVQKRGRHRRSRVISATTAVVPVWTP